MQIRALYSYITMLIEIIKGFIKKKEIDIWLINVKLGDSSMSCDTYLQHFSASKVKLLYF